MKIVFFGSSKYSLIDEKTLFNAFGLPMVVTTKSFPNPVLDFANKNDISTITTDKITDKEIREIKKVEPDFLVVADFRLILPKRLLEIPKKAAINIHHSLLPKYRGPAPVPYAILNGEETVGVTVMLMSEDVDAGDILSQEKYELNSFDTTDTVLTKLNELGGNLAVEVIKDFDKYFEKRTPQDMSQVTFSDYMDRDDGFIDLEKSKPTPEKLDLMIRAYYPWPGVWTLLRLKASDGQAKKEIRIKFLPERMVQVEGKKPVSYKDFLNGYLEAKPLLEKLGLV